MTSYSNYDEFPKCPFSTAICNGLDRLSVFFFPNSKKRVCALMQEDCNFLKKYLSESGKTVEELAIQIGDSPLRLYRVLSCEERLGKTARLAIEAVRQDLPAIEADE